MMELYADTEQARKLSQIIIADMEKGRETMTDRDRLMELYEKATEEYGKTNKAQFRKSFICDYLLANGVIVPPCKVGDKLYCVTNLTHSIAETVVMGMWIADGTFSILTIRGVIVDDSLGKKVFLTKEEAEAELKKRSDT